MSFSNPFGYCPICGVKYREHVSHRCKKSSYAAIDAANARAENGTEKLSDPLTRPRAERLDWGLQVLYREVELS